MDEGIYRKLNSFHEGFLVKLSVAKDAGSTMEIVPYLQSDPVPGARRMEKERESQFRQVLEEKSKAIQDDGFVQEQWLKFCDERKHDYLSCLLGHNRILRKLNARGLLEKCLYGRRPLLGVRNIVSCETHREAIETIFSHGMV